MAPQVAPLLFPSRKPPRCTCHVHPKGAIRNLHLHLPEADISRIKKKKKAQPSSHSVRELDEGRVWLSVPRLRVSSQTQRVRARPSAERREQRAGAGCGPLRPPPRPPNSAGVALGSSVCRGDGRACLQHRGRAEATACPRASSVPAWSPGFLGPDPAGDVGGSFVGTRAAETWAWHLRELSRAWGGCVLVPARRGHLSAARRELSPRPSLVHTAGFPHAGARQGSGALHCEEARRFGVVSRQSSDLSTSSRLKDN